MEIIAIYDACVLYSNFLRDFLIRLAIHGRRHGILRAKWTGRIHREWICAVLRNHPHLDRNALVRTKRLMDRHVRGCRVRGYERWEQRLTLPDEDDRHVLAAALACVADVIVTFNTSDFPPRILSPFGVVAVSPDTFVTQLSDSGIVVAAAREHRTSLKSPAMSIDEYLDALRRNRLPASQSIAPLSNKENIGFARKKLVSAHPLVYHGFYPQPHEPLRCHPRCERCPMSTPINIRLQQTIRDITAKIRRFRDRGLGEQNTKASLIEPVLEALGWDIRDPDEVHREYKPMSRDNPVDYALSILRKARLFVEAKGSGEPCFLAPLAGELTIGNKIDFVFWSENKCLPSLHPLNGSSR